jgi:hypothetical protein
VVRFLDTSSTSFMLIFFLASLSSPLVMKPSLFLSMALKASWLWMSRYRKSLQKKNSADCWRSAVKNLGHFWWDFFSSSRAVKLENPHNLINSLCVYSIMYLHCIAVQRFVLCKLLKSYKDIRHMVDQERHL